MLLAGCAELGHRSEALLAAAAGELEARAVECGPRDLADIVSAFGTLGFAPGEAPLAAAARRAAALLPAFPPLWLSWLMWGLARLDARPAGLLLALERQLVGDPGRLAQIPPPELARLTWALARLNHQSGERRLGCLA